MFPEWVGITGKKALEIHKHQKDENETGGENNSGTPPSV